MADSAGSAARRGIDFMVKLLSKPRRDLSTDYVSSENLVSSSNFLAEVTEFSEKIQLFLKAVSK